MKLITHVIVTIRNTTSQGWRKGVKLTCDWLDPEDRKIAHDTKTHSDPIPIGAEITMDMLEPLAGATLDGAEVKRGHEASGARVRHVGCQLCAVSAAAPS